MRLLRVIGMGAGSLGHISHDAAAALASSDAVVALNKGDAKADLLELRRRILAAHAPDLPLLTVDDPSRDRHPAGAPEYHREVQRWHQERARLLADTITSSLSDGQTAAFLVWGDPSLYDSTLRIIERMQNRGLECRTEVYPGITAVQALTAAHRILINRIGEPIMVTTGRQLQKDLDTSDTTSRIKAVANTVVMLDGKTAWTHPGIDRDHTYMWWGAYVSTDKQVLRKGWVGDIADEVARTKAELRAEHGWIMDTYLLRYFDPDGDDQPETLMT